MPSEHESKRLLAEYGVPVCRERTAPTPAGAVAAAEAIGYPVAVKGSGAGVAHKTELGLVRLGLADAGAVERAAAELLGVVEEVLVSEMVSGRRELIAGAAIDPQWGPTVMVGLGGILAEAVADVAFRLAPLDALDALAMLDELAAQRLLGPFRGEPEVDRDAVAECVVGLSRAVLGIEGVIAIDVNPLVVRDGTPVAVDALVVLEDEE